MPSLDSRTVDYSTISTGRDPILRFRERMNKPIRKFNARHYRSLGDDKINSEENDSIDSCDDMTTFSSVRLARDQDKPTKKRLGTWKSKIASNDDSSRQNPPRQLIFSDLARADSQISSFTHVLGIKSANFPTLMPLERNAARGSRNHVPRTVHSLIPLNQSRETIGKINSSFLRKEESKTTDSSYGALSEYFGAALRAEKSQVPDILPSPKENRQPKSNRTNGSSIYSARNPDEETTDARAALTPSSAMNLIQCWGRGNVIEENTTLIANDDVNHRHNADPLLVALQVVRLKKELKQLKKSSKKDHSFRQSRDDENGATSRSRSRQPPPIPSPTSSPQKKHVRFSSELVTEVRERPFTDPEDMEKLYFVYGELEELEFDRSTVEHDQFECIIQEESNPSLETYVEVEHNSRRLHAIGDDGLPHSMSDLSIL